MAQFVARLLEENESIKHLNELAWLTTDGFVMITRKFVSTSARSTIARRIGMRGAGR